MRIDPKDGSKIACNLIKYFPVYPLWLLSIGEFMEKESQKSLENYLVIRT